MVEKLQSGETESKSKSKCVVNHQCWGNSFSSPSSCSLSRSGRTMGRRVFWNSKPFSQRCIGRFSSRLCHQCLPCGPSLLCTSVWPTVINPIMSL
ncbi:unnamed protein product [Allacma fusca]|uniref:Uncharacterized protein n=1 Tax=Allacma fusca TaxID=39272 RepID=A0A8J2PA40_9HEXA|nr:unnamed protein product [Allacma fusca]